MKAKTIIYACVVLVVLGVCGYAGSATFFIPSRSHAATAMRRLHANLRRHRVRSRQEADVCCAHCAITEATSNTNL